MFIIINNTQSSERIFPYTLGNHFKVCAAFFSFVFLYQAGKSFVNFYVNGSDNSFETAFCSFSSCDVVVFHVHLPSAGADVE